MGLLELATDLGLNIKKTSNSRGGEYHSSCPACKEGVDRFVLWPKINRFWCRRCGISGDAIQFCRDYLNMSFLEARERNHDSSDLSNYKEDYRCIGEKVSVAVEPSKMWQDKALAFVEWSQKQLRQSKSAMDDFKQRGLNESTINQFKLGYCLGELDKDFFLNREEWGLPSLKVEGKVKKLWIPKGLVIPTISSKGNILKLKIRREKWHKEDPLPKYVEVSGTMQSPSIYGDTLQDVVIVVEAEIDALLINQAAKEICYCIALGGVSKKPDIKTDHLLRTAKLFLWCLDNDEAGKKAALWWRNSYPNLKFWPAPIGKSPGDAHKDHGLNLHDWILRGIEYYSKNQETL